MITQDSITLRKELLTEQLFNYQHSGYFTEKEIDRLSAPIVFELEQLAVCEAYNAIVFQKDQKVNSFEDLKNQFFEMVKKKFPNELEVIDAQILTPNNKQA